MSMTVVEAGRRGGSVRSERKAAAVRENGKLGGKKPRPLADIFCSCGSESLTSGHKSTCPRGRAIKRRLAKGQPLH
jgi:hypothetical protein